MGEGWLVRASREPALAPTVLGIGKLRRYKCADHPIRAMVEVVKRIPDATLTLAIRHDDLKYERELVAVVKELHLGASVSFRFNVTELEKRELLAATRVLVVPSVVEGFGIVGLEANASGG